MPAFSKLRALKYSADMNETHVGHVYVIIIPRGLRSITLANRLIHFPVK